MPPDSLLLDSSATVSSATFATLWDSFPLNLEVTGYSWMLHPLDDEQANLRRLTLAVESVGFFPVAAGTTAEGGYRTFVFGVGYYLTHPVRIEKYVICLFEFEFVRGDFSEVGMWVYCRCKCIDGNRTGEFMNLLVGAGIIILDWDNSNIE